MSKKTETGVFDGGATCPECGHKWNTSEFEPTGTGIEDVFWECCPECDADIEVHPTVFISYDLFVYSKEELADRKREKEKQRKEFLELIGKQEWP